MNESALTVTFRFAMHQNVQIVPLELTGRVFARCDRGDNVRDYRVIYWVDGKRCDEWLYEHELTDA